MRSRYFYGNSRMLVGFDGGQMGTHIVVDVFGFVEVVLWNGGQNWHTDHSTLPLSIFYSSETRSAQDSHDHQGSYDPEISRHKFSPTPTPYNDLVMHSPPEICRDVYIYSEQHNLPTHQCSHPRFRGLGV